MVTTGRSFIEVSNYVQIMEEIHYKVQGGSYKRLHYQGSLVKDEMAHVLKVTVLKVGTFHASLISIKFNLIGLFMLYFRLLMKVNLATVIVLARVVSAFERFIFWVF